MYIIEFLQDNAVQIAFVIEENNGKLRLLLPNRRELTLPENRILPWQGPQFPPIDSKETLVQTLQKHLKIREQIAAEVDTADIWEIAQGEVENAQILWLAELLYTQTNPDILAGVGRALLQDKVHFRYTSSSFNIFPKAVVEAKIEAEKAQKERERYITGGIDWFKTLWECRQNNKVIPPCTLDKEVQTRLKSMLLLLIAETKNEEDPLWRQVNKGLPDDNFMPLFLAMTWGIIPEHHNYWLDKAQYKTEENWFAPYTETIQSLIEKAEQDQSFLSPLPFISIDGATTKDIDDAFYIEKAENGWKITLALACPAAYWEFNSLFDKEISQRATSLYLPEGTYHMLPESLGTKTYSLFENSVTLAMLLECHVNQEGECISYIPSRGRAKVAANLTYAEVEVALENQNSKALPYKEKLQLAYQVASLLLQKRIEKGAVIIDRPDPVYKVEFNTTLPSFYENVCVTIEKQELAEKAQLLVSEFMVLANAGIAQWAQEHNFSLLYRTQDITIPKEYAGVWSKPEDIARIARSLTSASLEVNPKPHGGMGLTAYSPITSPLRRYSDLVNEAQILHYLEHNSPKWTQSELEQLLLHISHGLESSGQVQRMRPRYWKLMYFKQESKKALEQGDDYIWDGVLTEDFDTFVSIAFPKEQLFLRGKKALFPDKIQVGQHFKIRLGKINPLKNEIQILGVKEPHIEANQDFSELFSQEQEG